MPLDFCENMTVNYSHRFYALEYSETVQELPTKTILLAGSHWAKAAQASLFENIDQISIENLMVVSMT